MSSEPLAEEDLQYIKDALLDPTTGSLILLGSLAVNAVFLIGGCKLFEPWVGAQPWWEKAKKLQSVLMMNFGYKEEECTDESCLYTYAFVCVVCFHHLILGLMCLPVIISGGRSGYIAFLIAGIGELGFDIVDMLRMLATMACPEAVGMPQTPCFFFIVAGVCHHSLSIVMLGPMLLYYMTLPQFHYIVCALQLAAAIAYSTGSYKFTLDTTSPSGFFRYKIIVVIQLVTIWLSRGIIWFWCLWLVLTRFAEDEANGFWWGGLFSGILMSLFSTLMLIECTEAAVKWLPKGLPESEEEKQELEKAITKGDMEVPTASLKLRRPSLVGEGALLTNREEPVEVGAASKGDVENRS